MHCMIGIVGCFLYLVLWACIASSLNKKYETEYERNYRLTGGRPAKSCA